MSSHIVEAMIARVRQAKADLLYPNTPLQLEEGEGRVHFMVEGAWDSFEELPKSRSWRIFERNVKDHIGEVLAVHREFWTHDARLCLRPEWEGWRQINKAILEETLEAFGRYDATLE